VKSKNGLKPHQLRDRIFILELFVKQLFVCIIFIVLISIALVSISFAAENLPTPKDGVLSLSADQAIKLALSNNEKGKIAKEEVKKSKAVVLENTSNALPKITGIAGYNYNIEQPSQKLDFSAFNPLMEQMQLPPIEDSEIPLVYKHEWNFTLAVNQNIYTFGRIYNAIKLAKTYEKTAETGAKLTDEEIVLEATQAYYRLVFAKGARKIAVENYAISERHYKIVEAKYKAGLKSEFEYLQAKAELADDKPLVIQAKTGVELSQKHLLFIMGLPLAIEVVQTEPFMKVFPTQSIDELKDVAYRNRAEVKLSDLNTQMQRTTGNIYISNMLPVLAANMNYTWSGNSITDEEAFWPHEEDDWYNFWSVGVTFTWPFFDGLESVAKVRQYRAEERISKLKKTQLLKGIELEITQILREFDSLKEQVVAREETVALAAKAFNLATIRYDSGLGTTLEQADAQLLLMQAKLGYNRTLFLLIVTRAKLNRALGKEMF